MQDFIVLNLGHARTVHRWFNKDISSPFVRLFYVKHGHAVLHLSDGDVHLSEGNMYMLPSYTPHAYECDPDFDFYYLFVFLRKVEALGIFDLLDFPHEVKANDATRLLFENYCTLYPELSLPSKNAEDFINHQSYSYYVRAYSNMHEYERMQLHGLAEILFSYFVQYSSKRFVVSDTRISALLQYVQQHLRESITVEELADHACLTKSYLIRLFRQTLGVTPLQYVIRKKIQRAQTLLLEADCSVADVSREVGFADVSYFIRLFRKNIGFTPQEYRRELIG